VPGHVHRDRGGGDAFNGGLEFCFHSKYHVA
jgi:hypothetical protein